VSTTSTVHSVPPDLLRKIKKGNELFRFLFGDEETEDAMWKLDRFTFVDFEDTHGLLHRAGFSALHKTLDFENGNDEAFEYEDYDIQVASPAKVKKIAQELAKVTLAVVREKGLETEFRSDRRGELLKPEDYDAQFAEIERSRDFFAATAQAGNAVVAAAI
jgi:hypothetical protein